MLQELSHMDRITQLQDEIQNVGCSWVMMLYICRLTFGHWRTQLLTIMSNSIAHLTSKVNFVQVSPDVPITRKRNPDKVDPPEQVECVSSCSAPDSVFQLKHNRHDA